MEFKPASPSVWGPALWTAIHHIALGMIIDADVKDTIAHYKTFFTNLEYVLPCAMCRSMFREHLAQMPPIEDYMGSVESLFGWTIALHNLHNVALGKPIHPSPAEALRYLMKSAQKPATEHCKGCPQAPVSRPLGGQTSL